jgi:hypothetical protein
MTEWMVAGALVLAACGGARKSPARETSAVERARKRELARNPDAGLPPCDCKVVCECTDVPITPAEQKHADAVAADCRRQEIVCECPMCGER